MIQIAVKHIILCSTATFILTIICCLVHYEPILHLTEEQFGLIYNETLQQNREYLKSLYAEHKLLCFIPASKNKQEGIKAIIETWGQRCDKLLFFFGGDKLIESEINSKVNFVTLPMSQGTDAYEKLWEKVTLALEYIYEKYIDEFDWVLKADDNTYIVMENLRLFIRGKGLRLEYYGHKVWNSKYYNQGGAGYLMSQLVIKRLIENGFNKSCYPRDLGFRTYEDLWIGHCFSSVNVVMGNSLDNLGRHMFIPLSLELYLNPSKNQELFDLYQRYAVDPIRKGEKCCSLFAIGFHYIGPEDMRLIDFLIYESSVVYPEMASFERIIQGNSSLE